MPEGLPSWDEAVAGSSAAAPPDAGAGQPAQLPTWEDALKQPQASGEVNSNPAAGDFFKTTRAGRVMDAFFKGVAEPFTEGGPLGLSDDAANDLKKAGIFNDVSKGQNSIVRAVNEGVFRPAAAAGDAALRGFMAPFTGAAAALKQAGEEGLPGAEPASELVSGVTEGAFIGLHLPEPVARAKANHVLDGEAVYMGTKEPAPEQAQAIHEAAQQLPPEPEAPPKAPDIHEVARQVAPETFTQYDGLQRTSDALRAQLSDMADERTKSIDDQIKEIREAKQGGYGKLQALEDRREEIRASGDTPEMAEIRQKLQANDFQMRDLAPQVSEAYRTAQGRMPQETPSNEATPPSEASTVPSSAPNQPLIIPAESALPTELRDKSGELLPSIAEQESQKLQAAGRPKEEADTAAQLVAAHYQARAERFGGKRGTPEEMYGRDSANIRGGRERARTLAQKPEEGRELEQSARGKIRLATDDAKATITLMKSANASTFIHETGHHWLDEMMKDAVHEAAPDDLKKDAQTVRDWLGVKEGEDIATRQHEKFARGFERYMMEGTAPSKSLADVFRKFRDWLVQIYQTVSSLRAPITDDIRDVFDRLLAKNPEKTVVAPEREIGKTFADLHETEAENTSPEEASVTADNMNAERRALVRQNIPEEVHEHARGTSSETKRSETGITQPQLNFPATGTSTTEADTSAPSSEISAGGMETPAKNTGVKAKEDLHEKIPRRPLSLTEWMAKAGGVKDAGGELKAMDADKAHLAIDPSTGKRAPFAKKLVTEKGKSLDEMAEAALEAGYFPEKGSERPTIAELLNKISEDLKGNKQYSDNDHEELQAYNDALARNEEVERLVGEFDIDTKGKSPTQIWDEIAENMSLQDRVREAKEMAEDGHAEIEEADKKFKEWMESRGESWEPEKEPESRTLEDLENERQQEIASAEQKAGSASLGTPGSSPINQGTVQEGHGQGGGSIEPSGRGESQGSGELAEPSAPAGTSTSAGSGDTSGSHSKRTTEPPPGPNTLLGEPKSVLVDKAGNIRLDNLNTPEDVNEVLRETANQNNDFLAARRGVITDAQALDLADALGMDGKTLNMRKIGQAFNGEQILAARKLLIQSATSVRDAMATAATGDDNAVLAYAQAKARHQMIQEQVSGITAEAGRALRAFHKLEGQEEAQMVGDFLKQATGKDLFQLKEEAKLGAALDTPQKVSKFINDSRKPDFGNMALEYWVNGLISGPATHTTYMIGNTLLGLWKAIPETGTAALLGKLRGEENVRAGEIGAQLKGAAEGIPAALSAAGQALKSGVTTLLPGEEQRAMPLQPGAELATPGRIGNEPVSWQQLGADTFGAVKGLRDAFIATGDLIKSGGVKDAALFGTRQSPLGSIPDVTIKGVAIPVGSVIRAPARAIAAIHSFFRTVNYSMAKSALVYREAASAGLDKDAFAAHVADGVSNPSEAVMQESVKQATDLTLMGQGGQFTQALSRLTNTRLYGFPLLKFIDPFVHIGSNVIEQGVMRRTPIGLLSPEIRADMAGVNGPAARDFAQARMIVGSALAVTVGGLAAEGLVSGSGPSDPKESAAWRMLGGNQPHSVRIGDMWYDVHRLGPLGMLVGIAADMYGVAKTAAEGDMLQAGSSLVHAITQNILDESFMRGPSDLIKALTDSDRYGPAYLKNFISSFVPFSVGMSQAARAIDPYSRQARTIMDAIKAKIPFVSEGLYPRRDIWGEPIANKDTLGPAGFSAIYETKVNKDPVNKAMLANGYFPAQPMRKIRGVELNDQQYDDYCRVAGRLAKMRLNAIVAQPGFTSLPPGTQHDTMKSIVESARESARSLVLMQNPEIINRAVENKKQFLRKGTLAK